MAQWLRVLVKSARLPPMWPGLLVLVPALRVFSGFSGFSGFPPSAKTNISKFQFDLEAVERRATSWIPLKFHFIYFFINLLFCGVFVSFAFVIAYFSLLILYSLLIFFINRPGTKYYLAD